MPANATDPNTPVGVDPTRASVARVYDFFLGGKDNYEVDRAAAGQVKQAMPEVADGARANRDFLIRACRFLATQTDVTQFLDLGSGLPTAENTHQVVQRVNAESKVVYVDNDPVVLAHGRALLEEDERTRLIDADVYQPQAVLQHEVVRTHLDLSRPVALFMVATLHGYVGDKQRPVEIMREYIDALPSGSYVALSHIYDPESDDSPAVKAMVEAALKSNVGRAAVRTKPEIEALLEGLEMISPGVVPLVDWWPDGPRLKPLNAGQRIIAGGVGRKP